VKFNLSTQEGPVMSLKTSRGGFVVELSSVHAFVKLGRYETFVSFEKDCGPAGRRVIFSRAL